MIDRDIAHSFYDGIDINRFTVFEVTDGLARSGTDNDKPKAASSVALISSG